MTGWRSAVPPGCCTTSSSTRSGEATASAGCSSTRRSRSCKPSGRRRSCCRRRSGMSARSGSSRGRAFAGPWWKWRVISTIGMTVELGAARGMHRATDARVNPARAEAEMGGREAPSGLPRPCRLAALGLASLLVFACRPDGDDRYDLTHDTAAPRRAPATDGVSVGVAVSNTARYVTTLTGLRNPESVRYDAEQDVYFISNMAGYGSVKDGNGYIVRASAADLRQSSIFARGGIGGVTLDAPKGMAISGDTLWVADIDRLRGFHRVTGGSLATVDFAPLGAVLLNDVALGPGGELRVTDTGIRMTEIGVWFVGPARVFAVGPGATIRTVAEGSVIGQPNGIAWDST